jgi:hypothetical protein
VVFLDNRLIPACRQAGMIDNRLIDNRLLLRPFVFPAEAGNQWEVGSFSKIGMGNDALLTYKDSIKILPITKGFAFAYA